MRKGRPAVAAFEPDQNAVVLEGCKVLRYDRLVVAPGLKLAWDRVEGLPETLGQNGVTSNYRFDLAPYTWELVQKLKRGRAHFSIALAVGRPDLAPETPVQVQGFKDVIDAETWIIEKISHSVSSGGYISQIDLEALLQLE